MPGRVLAQAFERPPDPSRLASWDAVPGNSGMHPAGFTMPPSDAELLMRRFIDFGCIDGPKEDKSRLRPSAAGVAVAVKPRPRLHQHVASSGGRNGSGIKQVARKPEILREAAGKVLKDVAPRRPARRSRKDPAASLLSATRRYESSSGASSSNR
jgi:hypothetical protein